MKRVRRWRGGGWWCADGGVANGEVEDCGCGRNVVKKKGEEFRGGRRRREEEKKEEAEKLTLNMGQ